MAITPASGFVPAWSAVIFGVVGAVCCNYATKLKYLLGVDDALDIFAEHGIGGIVGNLLTAFFAAYVPPPLCSLILYSLPLLFITLDLGLVLM